MPKRGAAKKKAAAAKKRNARKTAEVVGKDDALLKEVSEAQAVGGFWRPSVEGDTIIGEVLSMREETGKYGKQLVVIIGNRDGAQTLYANANMRTGLEYQGVQPGDRVAIQFKGTMSIGRGRPMKLFAVKRSGGPRKGAAERAQKSLTAPKRKGRKRRR